MKNSEIKKRILELIARLRVMEESADSLKIRIEETMKSIEGWQEILDSREGAK